MREATVITWYDKLALAGLAVAFIGAMMFIAGLWFAMDARNKSVASYRASIQEARQSLRDATNAPGQ